MEKKTRVFRSVSIKTKDSNVKPTKIKKRKRPQKRSQTIYFYEQRKYVILYVYSMHTYKSSKTIRFLFLFFLFVCLFGFFIRGFRFWVKKIYCYSNDLLVFFLSTQFRQRFENGK